MQVILSMIFLLLLNACGTTMTYSGSNVFIESPRYSQSFRFRWADAIDNKLNPDEVREVLFIISADYLNLLEKVKVL